MKVYLVVDKIYGLKFKNEITVYTESTNEYLQIMLISSKVVLSLGKWLLIKIVARFEKEMFFKTT